jgi:hypothetical protein
MGKPRIPPLPSAIRLLRAFHAKAEPDHFWHVVNGIRLHLDMLRLREKAARRLREERARLEQLHHAATGERAGLTVLPGGRGKGGA